MGRNYKKPLKETRTIDYWKCPYCRELNGTVEAMEYSNFSINDGEFKEICPKCGKTSEMFISPMYIVRPCDDEDDE